MKLLSLSLSLFLLAVLWPPTVVQAQAPALPAMPLTIGAQAPPAGTQGNVSAHRIVVDSAASAADAIATAGAGQVIVFAPGTYRFSSQALGRKSLRTSSAAGVTLRARVPGTVFLEFDLLEGIVVQAPRWTVENLHIRGVCRDHSDCEHAFHVVKGATGFVARNNTIVDFNAHFKINGADGLFPDGGLIEANTIRNSSVRNTANAVTLIDLVGASGWTVRANLIADFIKGGGDHTSYGAFAKGAGAANRFERNVVLCESRLRGTPGTRVGLSLGGGGTGAPYCRDRQCASEQSGGVIAANLIAACSDEGIYLNRAAASEVTHNTLVRTAGIMLRYPETSALVEGNLVDGRIAASKDAAVTEVDNLASSLAGVILRGGPLRTMFADPDRLDLRWNQRVLRRARSASTVPELCGKLRPASPTYGAFEDISCLGLSAQRPGLLGE